jgi:predicted nuclease with TOPRIM domain
MPFTIKDYHDLVRLLTEQPEWRAELRRLLISEDLQALPGIMRELAEAQRRTEQKVAELAEAQRRSEERLNRLEESVAALAEAQRRTEQKVAELAEAQRRSEERLGGVERALKRLSQQVGGLSETVGGDIEDIAYIVLHDVLKREFGWQVGVLGRSWQTWDGKPEEVNVFGQASDPARPDQVIWIVGEAKHNLAAREVERFIRQVERARRHLEGEVFAVCFCYRVRPEVQQMVRNAGIRLVFSYGKLM